jgi:hypothetical protein
LIKQEEKRGKEKLLAYVLDYLTLLTFFFKIF